MHTNIEEIVAMLKKGQIVSQEIKQTIADTIIDDEFWGLQFTSFLKKVNENTNLSKDSVIQDAMRTSIPKILDILKTTSYDDHPWEAVLHIMNIPKLMDNDDIQESLPHLVQLVKEALWDDWVFEVLRTISHIPFICADPEVRIIVGCQSHTIGKQIHQFIRESQEWMSTSLIRTALGESLDNVPDVKYEQEIEDYCSLLVSYEEPWNVLDLVKDVPRLWKDARIQNAIGRSVPQIANGIRESRYPLRIIVRTLLIRSAITQYYADAPWAYKHEVIDKALQDSAYRVLEELGGYHDALRHSFQLALWDAGVGKLEVEVPRIGGSYAYHDHDRFYGVVDVKGWDYVCEKMAEQLKKDPSYAEVLIEQMPTDFDHYFDERSSFPREFGFRLVSLLFPYKPKGYIEAMKVVYEISWSAKGHEWVWEKYQEELEWVEKEANLRSEDFM